ncbi:glycosyltransferase family 2 protein [Spiroplasma culicicola]|uniref:Glycosyltransferase n=1 Tax=Spiroplasma culicicola AES-1 TaxID=1276246 RepID=W6A6G4_9MOLU|nr:glycosyltransferase family 2 protein [Spiroplasma culicicola]AHI52450.1 glycosyltransferase [Spiroplasma culicicola AES-1]
MLISFVVVSQEVEESIENTMNSIAYQTDDDYEIILVSDRSIVENTKETFGKDKFWANNNFKLVLNNSVQGVSVSWNSAIDLAEGKYIKFVNQGDTLDQNFVATVKKELAKHAKEEIDVVEYKGKMFGLNDSETDIFLEPDKIYDLSQEFCPYAFTNVTLFNKLFRTKLLQEFGFKFRRFVRFDLLFVYKVLGQTEKYLYLDSPAIENYLIEPVAYSAFDLVNQWTHILNYYRRIAKFKELKDQLNYAYYKTMVHIWLWLIKQYNNKLLMKKATNFASRKFEDKKADFIKNNSVFVNTPDEKFKTICLSFEKYIKEILKLAK